MVGLIALAAVLATTLPGVAGTITSTARTMICKVGGTSCPSSSSPGQGSGSGSAQRPNLKPLDPSAPTNGARIGGYPRDVGAGLPFPGSVSATVDAEHEGSTQAGSKGGYKVGVSATYERARRRAASTARARPA